tara:strand:+ start:7580 stop:7918 length:339 start_codon:yes stop_codon:yes gene_type:complete
MSQFKSMEMPELSKWYTENVGYDLAEDDPSITLEAFRRMCEDIEREANDADQDFTPPPRDNFQEAIELLTKAEIFIAGFENDESQEGVDELLAEIRSLLSQDPRESSSLPPA